jgi:hypothetical protein
MALPSAGRSKGGERQYANWTLGGVIAFFCAAAIGTYIIAEHWYAPKKSGADQPLEPGAAVTVPLPPAITVEPR